MFSKSRILVFFLALGIFAAPENISVSSAPFSFAPTGVIYQNYYSMMGSHFSYKKLTNGKQALQFSWSIRGTKKSDMGKLSLYTVSGKLIKSFDLASPEKSISWSMPHGKMANGVYFAVLTYGLFKKNLKIIY
jgi:hypothetical protein